MASIYIIQNKETGKKYVGKTILDPQKRWKQHKQIGSKLHNLNESHYNSQDSGYSSESINKQGVEILYLINVSRIHPSKSPYCKCNHQPIGYVSIDTYSNGYHSTFGGEGAVRDIDLAFHPT